MTKTGRCFVEKRSESFFLNQFEAVKLATKYLRDDSIVVIDEFQRLNVEYWEMLVKPHPKGRLFLSGSSLRLVTKVFNRKSPLLGFLIPFKIDLISPEDVILSLVENGLPIKDAILWAVIVRDPWIIPYLNFSNKPWKELAELAPMLTSIVTGLTTSLPYNGLYL